MQFKGPKAKLINRLGNKFESDTNGILNIDIDSVTSLTITVEDGNEVKTRSSLSDEERKELISTIKAYGFSEVIEGKK